MNRQIKFRGLRIDGKGWVYGSLSIEYDGSCFISYWFSKLIEPENNYHEMTCEWHEVIPESVGQFTGLKDKNGVEVWEGDKILTLRGDWGIIVYKAPFFEVTVSEDQSSMYSREWFNTVEVIGNTHEK